MKYIRTRDGIFEIECLITTGVGVLVRGKNEKTFNKISDCKVADTIEELCDEFVIKHNYNTVLPYEIVNSLKPILNGMKVYIDEFKKSDVYGAIWTEWGLKYVAKMNEEGELELL